MSTTNRIPSPGIAAPDERLIAAQDLGPEYVDFEE